MSTPVVLITGALTGIGRATALAFAQEGARIVVSGRRDQEGQALTQELRALGVDPVDRLPATPEAVVRHGISPSPSGPWPSARRSGAGPCRS